jgi:hypothetical protein
LKRRFFACPGCKLNGYHVDEQLGLDGFLSPRMMRFSASSVAVESFRASRDSIQEFLGVRVAAETLRKQVEAAATAMQDWAMDESVGVSFAAAPGCIEFQIDAGKVNTQEGWRDFKICTFAKRPLADPATADEWDTRVLPNVTTRITVAALESIAVFEKRLRPLAAHLGIEDTSTIHTLGDGAEWIWNTATSQFPGGPQTLDIYHGCEWISATSKILYAQTGIAASQPATDEPAASPQAGDTGISASSTAETAVPAAVAAPPTAMSAVAMSAVVAALVAVAAPAAAESVEASSEAAPPVVLPASAPHAKVDQTKPRSPNLSAAEKAKAKQAKRLERKQTRSQKPKSEPQKSYERGREQLLNKGWQGICNYVAEELAKGDTPERRSSLEGLVRYFSQHISRLNYNEGLSAGLVIGSGMVEGNVKTLGLRLKARGARWKVDNVGRMAALIGLRRSTHWNAYWSSLQASPPRPRRGEDVDCLSTAA